MGQTMISKDAVIATQAECYLVIRNGKNEERYNFMQAINVEASMEKNKVEIPILGQTGKGNRATGWTGTGSATFHYNTSIFRELLFKFKNTGEDTFFDMQITNNDTGSTAGMQTIILKNCSIDGGILAKFDADGEYLDEEMDFTFDDWEMPKKFTILSGMEDSKK